MADDDAAGSPTTPAGEPVASGGAGAGSDADPDGAEADAAGAGGDANGGDTPAAGEETGAPKTTPAGEETGAPKTTPAGEETGAPKTTPAGEGSDDPPVPSGDVGALTTDVRSISPRIQLYWGVRLVVGLTVLTALARVGLGSVGPAVDMRVVLGGAGVLGVLGLAWVHVRYRVWSYHLRADALTLGRGVFTHVRTVAPHVRVQHVDTSRGPLERALGLSTLVVYTAGSRGADVSIPGLTPGEASDLQRRLKELAIESEGGDAL